MELPATIEKKKQIDIDCKLTMLTLNQSASKHREGRRQAGEGGPRGRG